MIEFQVRDSPHVHIFICILTPPNLSSETIETSIKFFDQVINANLPSHEDDPFYMSSSSYIKSTNIPKIVVNIKISYVGMDLIGVLMKEHLFVNN